MFFVQYYYLCFLEDPGPNLISIKVNGKTLPLILMGVWFRPRFTPSWRWILLHCMHYFNSGHLYDYLPPWILCWILKCVLNSVANRVVCELVHTLFFKNWSTFLKREWMWISYIVSGGKTFNNWATFLLYEGLLGLKVMFPVLIAEKPLANLLSNVLLEIRTEHATFHGVCLVYCVCLVSVTELSKTYLFFHCPEATKAPMQDKDT